MSRHKLRRFAELKTFQNTFEFPIEMKGKWDPIYFKNKLPIVLELGCGRGEYTVGLSGQIHDKNFIGIDLKGARLWKGAKTCFEEKLSNAAFIRSRIELIDQYFDKGEVSEIWITFPDPQPKDRWEKKRLTAANYLDIYRKIMSPKGIIHLKTDSTFLFEYTFELVKSMGLKILFSHPDIYSLSEIKPEWQIETKYERIFKLKGETIKYLQFAINP